jgi:hypothetical protein
MAVESSCSSIVQSSFRQQNCLHVAHLMRRKQDMCHKVLRKLKYSDNESNNFIFIMNNPHEQSKTIVSVDYRFTNTTAN